MLLPLHFATLGNQEWEENIADHVHGIAESDPTV